MVLFHLEANWNLTKNTGNLFYFVVVGFFFSIHFFKLLLSHGLVSISIRSGLHNDKNIYHKTTSDTSDI